MSKRFTDSEKWADPWFSDLPPLDKLFWMYLLDNCDHAGIWKVHIKLAEFHLGFKPELLAFNGRYVKLGKEKIFIPGFIEFQYGTLNEMNRVHKSVIDRLKKEGAYKALNSPSQGVKDKDKDKAKDKDKVKDRDKKPAKKRATTLPDDWQPNDKHRSLALEHNIDIATEADVFRDYSLSKGWTKVDWDATFRNWIRRASGFKQCERLTAAEQLSQRNKAAVKAFLGED